MSRKIDKLPAADLPMARINWLSWLLDNSIRVPKTNYRIGLDPVIGLIPGIGDAIGGILSAYIIAEAARARLPLSILLRMVLNVAIEVIVGAVPLVGDLFDMTWKANARNTRLIEKYTVSSKRTVVASKLLVGLVIVALVLIVGFSIYLSFLILMRLGEVLIQ
ncbi:MAG: DUF4112 domain-containing protein [Desulfatitalea sp.]|nr:DUF4112 domain-containing protein [Desulfatitalea sp.]